MYISKGPNLAWYVITGWFLFVSVMGETSIPILGWIAFNGLLVPICLWLNNYNEKQRIKMLEDFPHDPYIQRKYGGK